MLFIPSLWKRGFLILGLLMPILFFSTSCDSAKRLVKTSSTSLMKDIGKMVQLIGAKDYKSLIQNYAKPEDIKKMGDIDEVVANFDEKAALFLLKNLKLAQKATPKFEDNYTKAIFDGDEFDRPVLFEKGEGRWFLRDK